MSDGWDDDLERALAQIHAIADAEETTWLAEMAIGLEAVPEAPSAESNRPPAPGEFHPYYEPRRQWLTHWLDNETTWHVRMPVPPVLRLVYEPVYNPWDMGKENVLQRRHTWGVAPYVGDPFVYAWWCASDDYGRWIAGSATTIHYTGPRR